MFSYIVYSISDCVEGQKPDKCIIPKVNDLIILETGESGKLLKQTAFSAGFYEYLRTLDMIRAFFIRKEGQ